MKGTGISIIVVAALALQGAWALDINEKLTLRILKLSKTKKTILINRGVEDGLKIGDHAKLYLTTGMIARGVVVKTAPARSIWSLYRLIDTSFLIKDKVIYLKVATPVKITPDRSKMVMVEPIVVPGEEIPISPDAEALELAAEISDKNLNERDELGALEDGQYPDIAPSPSVMASFLNRPWEVMLHGHFNGSSEKVESETPKDTLPPDEIQSENSNSLKSYDIGLGLERYFLKKQGWPQRFSLHTIFHFGKSSSLDIDGNSISSSFWEGGAGASYHFYNRPKSMGKPIAYITAGAGIGKAKDLSQINNSEPTDNNTQDLDGSTQFFQVGLGVKYYSGRWGGKLQVGHYQRRESYAIEYEGAAEGDSLEKKKTLSGPQFILGFLFRF